MNPSSIINEILFVRKMFKLITFLMLFPKTTPTIKTRKNVLTKNKMFHMKALLIV